MPIMQSWESLSVAEQTVMRRAVSGYRLAGLVQNFGVVLRWAGAPDAPPARGYSQDQERALVPLFVAVVLDLAEGGLLSVRETRGSFPGSGDPYLTGTQLRAALADPANWLQRPILTRCLWLSAPQPVREHWFADAHPVADPHGLPTWDELSIAEREVLVCAYESSSKLTGFLGIWEDPPTELDPADRLAWVQEQVSPLLPFVRNGWIEVYHYLGNGDQDLIPADHLATALVDPALRPSWDSEWDLGVGCAFTYAGLAVWHGAWSREWNRRLTID